MSPAEWSLLDSWMKRSIPLRVILQAMGQAGGTGKTLAYYARAVDEEFVRWQRALQVGG
jgi:hypothetical protein